MNSPIAENQTLPVLTPEENRILKECGREATIQRAIPLSIVAGVCGHILGRKGALNHHKFGAKPAAIGFGLIGYFIGKLSYGKICLQRVLQVPDGYYRKMMDGQLQSQNSLIREVPSHSQYYADVEIPKNQDTVWDTPTASADIDVASMSSFDTVPSDYYQAHPDDITEQIPTQNFTSYDDLRKQNRDDFTNRFRVPPQQQSSQQRYPHQKRPEQQDTQPSNFGKQQTKYGDTWE